MNGFVGSTLAEHFKGDFVVGVGRKEANRQVPAYYQWDIRKWDDEIANAIADMDIEVIIHAAASLSIDDDDTDLVETNVLGSFNVYRLAKIIKRKLLFYISSAPIIGVPLDHPITEEHPMNPQLMYHATKLAGEYILNQLNRYGTEVVNLRINAPIGRNMPIKSIVPIFISNAVAGKNLVVNGQGTRQQTYLDVRDLGKVIEDNLARKDIAGTYIIAGEKAISNLDLARLCIAKANSKSQVVFSGKSDAADGVVWDYDCSKARTKLRFVPQYSIEDSVDWIIRTYKDSFLGE